MPSSVSQKELREDRDRLIRVEEKLNYFDSRTEEKIEKIDKKLDRIVESIEKLGTGAVKENSSKIQAIEKREEKVKGESKITKILVLLSLLTSFAALGIREVNIFTKLLGAF